jgi:hypothetical protein
MIVSALARKALEEEHPEKVTAAGDALCWADVMLLACNKTQIERTALFRRHELVEFLSEKMNRKSRGKFNYAGDWIELLGRIDENSFGIRANINYSYAYGLYPQLSFFKYAPCEHMLNLLCLTNAPHSSISVQPQLRSQCGSCARSQAIGHDCVTGYPLRGRGVHQLH